MTAAARAHAPPEKAKPAGGAAGSKRTHQMATDPVDGSTPPAADASVIERAAVEYPLDLSKGFVWFSRAVFDRLSMQGGKIVAVWLIIHCEADHGGQCVVSPNSLARDLGIDAATVRRLLRKLERLEIIDLEIGPKTAAVTIRDFGGRT